MSVCLILRSIGEDELREGQILTSMSQGLRLESISISKPYSSKQEVLLYWVLVCISSMLASFDIQVLITTSSTSLKT